MIHDDQVLGGGSWDAGASDMGAARPPTWASASGSYGGAGYWGGPAAAGSVMLGPDPGAMTAGFPETTGAGIGDLGAIEMNAMGMGSMGTMPMGMGTPTGMGMGSMGAGMGAGPQMPGQTAGGPMGPAGLGYPPFGMGQGFGPMGPAGLGGPPFGMGQMGFPMASGFGYPQPGFGPMGMGLPMGMGPMGMGFPMGMGPMGPFGWSPWWMRGMGGLGMGGPGAFGWGGPGGWGSQGSPGVGGWGSQGSPGMGGWGSQGMGGGIGAWGSQGMGGGGSSYAPGLWSAIGPYTGRRPRGYRRSDDRIREDANDALTLSGLIDPSEIDVIVLDGVLTLDGAVETPDQRRMAEDAAQSVPGVRDVQNRLNVSGGQQGGGTQAAGQGQTAGGQARTGEQQGQSGGETAQRRTGGETRREG